MSNSSTDITQWSAVHIASQVNEGKVRAVEVVEAFLARIKQLEPKVHAFVTVLEQKALEQARVIDQKIASGRKAGRLAGVPVAIKDNIMIAGAETTCSSQILKGYVAPYDATVIERLRREDAVFIGKTNLDEFAMGSSTENSAFFKTHNPWDLDRVPGGSSGGSAAAVASRMAALALGSDTGGSIRQPAALCGVIGIKPTYGLVSRYGLVAFASSLDQIGPFARSAEDAARALSVIVGHDPKDSTSASPTPEQMDYLSRIDGGLSGITVGVPKEYFEAGMDSEVERSVRDALNEFERLGCNIRQVSLPHTRYALSAYYLIAPAEASANLARFDGIRYGHSVGRQSGPNKKQYNLMQLYELSRGSGFGPEVKRRIMLGTYALSSGYYDAYYGKAQRVRTLIQRDFDNAFRSVDVLLTPTSPTPAWTIGEKASDPLKMYLSDIYTIPCNLAGHAGMAIPCGLTKKGLPIGVQLMSKPFKEAIMLQMAKLFGVTKPFSGLKN